MSLLSTKRYTLDRIFRLIASLVLLILFLWVVHYLRDVLVPFVIAFLLAYIMHPVVTYVERYTWNNRVVALIVTILGLIIALTLTLTATLPFIASQMRDMADIVRKILIDTDLAQRMQDIIPAALVDDIRLWIAENDLQKVLQQRDVLSMVKPVAGKLVPGIWGAFTGAAALINGILSLSVIVMYLAFLLLDFETAQQEWKDLLPKEYHKPVLGFLHEFQLAMRQYFTGQLLIAIITGILLAIGFSLIGMPMAIFLGLGIGLLNIVPYLQLIGIIPAGILGLLHAIDTDANIMMYLGLIALVFIVVQIIQDAFLTPRIMGKSTGLSPAFILLSLSIWGKVLGLLGLMIALPITCVLIAIYKQSMRK